MRTSKTGEEAAGNGEEQKNTAHLLGQQRDLHLAAEWRELWHKTTAWAPAEYHTGAWPEHSPQQQQPASSPNNPFRAYKYNMMYNWCHLSCDSLHPKKVEKIIFTTYSLHKYIWLWITNSDQYWGPGIVDSEDVYSYTWNLKGAVGFEVSAEGLQMIIWRNQGVYPTKEAIPIHQKYYTYFSNEESVSRQTHTI